MLNLLYSIGGTGIFNVVLQLVIYPDFERRMGADAYGVALSVISLVAITAGTCGYAASCARLLGVKKGWTNSGDYNRILWCMGLLGSMIGIAYLFYLGIATPLSVGLFTLLNFSTMLRYYSEVEFRISTDFLRYMIYHILISAGYVAGLFLFHLSDQWMIALILGETLAILYVVFRGTIYRPPFLGRSAHLIPILSSTAFLFLSVLIDNITLHADRILLLAMTGDGSAVSTYYIASLVGKIVAMLTSPINALVLSYLVRYDGGLSRKIWLLVIGASLIFGGAAFGGCMLISPWMIGLLYPDSVDTVKPYLAPAVLGQILYFISGFLMIILLRFKGEKRQLIFNAAYAVEFFVCVAIGTALWGLWGFALSVVFANAIRFLTAILWGFFGKKRPT